MHPPAIKLGFQSSLTTLPTGSRFKSSMQFPGRRFPIISRIKRVFIGRIDDGGGMEARLKRLFAVAASKESADEPKKRRVSKLERRKMIKKFVDRYRASNAGKFPTISLAQKEIGGSYYTIRQMIQELEYNHKLSPQKTKQPIEVKKIIDVIESSTNLNNDSEDPLVEDGEAVGLFEAKSLLDASDSEKTSKQELTNSPTTEVTHSNESLFEIVEDSSINKHSISDKNSDYILYEKNHPTSLEATKVHADSSTSLKFESDEDNLHTSVNDKQDINEGKASVVRTEGGFEQSSNEVLHSEELDSNKPTTLKEDRSSQKGSSIWGNLRSIADGIINFWKNH